MKAREMKIENAWKINRVQFMKLNPMMVNILELSIALKYMQFCRFNCVSYKRLQIIITLAIEGSRSRNRNRKWFWYYGSTYWLLVSTRCTL